ncbi:MAG: hypothetical protein IKM42_05080 [Clostridia bacterium]|nr:hypothetical protein [Clostridia bacterium]
MANTTKTKSQEIWGLVGIPLCLAYMLWLIWPIISFVAFCIESSNQGMGFFDGIGLFDILGAFDWSILLMYVWAYPIGFVLLFGIKMLVNSRYVRLHPGFHLDGLAYIVIGYPVFVFIQAIDYLRYEVGFADALGIFLQAIIKGGVLFIFSWTTDSHVMLMFSGIILLIFLFDCLWHLETKSKTVAKVKNIIYVILSAFAIGITVYGCVTEFGRLGKDYLDLVGQVLPICIPLTLVGYYTHCLTEEDANDSYFAHILPLVICLALAFLGAYLVSISTLLFLLVPVLGLGVAVWHFIANKGLPCRKHELSEKSKQILAELRAERQARYGNASGGGSTNAPVKQNLPEDSGCEKLRSRLKGMYGLSGSYGDYLGFRFSYKAALSTCRQGSVVWNVSISASGMRSSYPDKHMQEDYFKSKKEEIRSFIVSQTESVIRGLADQYKTYGGSWTVTVRI